MAEEPASPSASPLVGAPAGVSVLSYAAFDAAMEVAVEAWKACDPGGVRDFEEYMRDMRDGARPDYYAEGKFWKWSGEVPKFVHDRIAEIIKDRHWFKVKVLRDRFFRRFAAFRANPHSFLGTTPDPRGDY